MHTQGPVHIDELHAWDESACSSFFALLDPHDIRMRFGARQFSMHCFLPADAATGVAFAAFGAGNAILGVVNLIHLSDEVAEIAVIVRSDQKRRGIGRCLVAHALRQAKAEGLTRVIGYICHANWPMRMLARAMGFQCVRSDAWFIEVSRQLPEKPIAREACAA